MDEVGTDTVLLWVAVEYNDKLSVVTDGYLGR